MTELHVDSTHCGRRVGSLRTHIVITPQTTRRARYSLV